MIQVGLKDPEISENEQFFREFLFALYLSMFEVRGTWISTSGEKFSSDFEFSGDGDPFR